MWSIAIEGVAWSVGHDREPCASGWTDCDAIPDVDSGGPEELCIRWGSKPPMQGAILREDDVGIFQHATEYSQWSGCMGIPRMPLSTISIGRPQKQLSVIKFCQ